MEVRIRGHGDGRIVKCTYYIRRFILGINIKEIYIHYVLCYTLYIVVAVRSITETHYYDSSAYNTQRAR